MKKVFLIAGHGGGDPGAIGLGYKEAQLTIELRNIIKAYLEMKGIVVFIDNDTWDLNMTIKWIESLCTPDDLLIDIHFNANSSPTVGGSEVIIPDRNTAIERTFAAELLAEMLTTLGTKNRKVKTEADTARKRLGIFKPNCQNVLLEVCFISSPEDMKSYWENKVKLAEKLAGVIKRYALKENVQFS